MSKQQVPGYPFIWVCLAFIIVVTTASVMDAGAVHLTAAPDPSASQNIDYLGRIGSTVNVVYVLDNLAYVGEQMGLVVLDVSDPAEPTVLSQALDMKAIVDVFVVQGTAYALDQLGWLHVVDVSNPHEPGAVGSLQGTPGKIHVENKIAFVAAGQDGLWMVDVSDPGEPQEVGWYKPSYELYAVFVVQQTAYVAAGLEGMHVLDISDPALPVEQAGYAVQWAFDVSVHDHIAYVAYADFKTSEDGQIVGLRTVDVAGPTPPETLGAYEVDLDEWGDLSTQLSVVQDAAYLANGLAGLWIVDVSEPEHPSAAGAFDTAGMSTESLFVASHTAHLVLSYTTHSLLQMVDVSDRGKPSEVGNYDPPDNVRNVHVVGDVAYGAAFREGLRVIDVSDPVMLRQIGAYPDTVYDVFVRNDVAYLAAEIGLRTVDVTDPTNPTALGQQALPELPDAIFVAEDMVYVTYTRAEWNEPTLDHYVGLAIVDVSNPAQPDAPILFEEPVGPIDLVKTDLSVTEDRVTLTYETMASWGQLLILDVADRHNPQLLGRYDYGDADGGRGVFVRADIAYATASNGLHIVDASDPTNPALMNVFLTPDRATGVYISGSKAFLTTVSDLQVVEMSDPWHPHTLGHYDFPFPGTFRTIFGSDDIAYVAGDVDGLVIYRYAPEHHLWLPMLVQ